jgi:transcriptional regulator with XRE-family HTH domain
MKPNNLIARIELVNKVGKRIQELRLGKGMSQEDLALKSDINKNYLSDLERGTRNPTIFILKKIADGLEISLEELFKKI